jgi:hypothetical protein
MPPTMLILVQPARRTVVPVRDPAQWDGQACATCGRRIENDPAVFLVEDELRCQAHVVLPRQVTGCVWCGRTDSPVRDTGDRYCQPHWAVFVAWISDVVESPEWKDLMAAARQAASERQEAQGDTHPEAQGQGQADRGGGS